MTVSVYSSLWNKIVQGTVDPPIKSLPLKIKVNFLRMQIKTKKINVEDAARELAQYCLQNEKMLESDLAIIKQFNTYQL